MTDQAYDPQPQAESRAYFDESIEIPVKAKNSSSNEARFRQLVGEERFWATLAHAMGPLTIMMIVFTDSWAWLLSVMFTGAIYLYHSDKSTMVKYHARQAFIAQLFGTFGWLALVISGTLVWVVALLVSLILILVLVGLVLAPIVAVAYPIFIIGSFILPIGVALGGTIGAWEAWHGRDFRYPYLAKKIEKWFGDASATREVVLV